MDIENERLPPHLIDEPYEHLDEHDPALRRRGSGKRQPAQLDGLERSSSTGGTTRNTSPSNRQRSIEDTMARIKETVDGHRRGRRQLYLRAC